MLRKSGSFETMQNLRLDVRHLTKLVLFFAVLPLGIGIALDIATGLLPYITIVVGIIFLPLASFFLTRATLSELDRIIQQLAPEEEFLDNEASN